MLRSFVVCLLATAVFGTCSRPSSAADPAPESYLVGGKLAEGEKALRERLEKNPRDDKVRFALGGAQFLRGLERIGQSLHEYGLREQNVLGMNIVVLNLPFGKNEHPKKLTYEKARSIVQDWIGDLDAAEKTLSTITDAAVALPVQVDQISFDVGNSAQPVRLLEVLAVTGLAPREGGRAYNDPILIRFDRTDVAWLRAYCHLLSAIGNVVLAHDGRDLFDHTAHLFFADVDTPYPFLKLRTNSGEGWDVGYISDLIAAIHLLRLPVVEPARMKAALSHLEQVIALSREMWKFALAETDNDHEWIPNPKQKGPFGVTITQQQVDAWMKFLEESEGLLVGRLLVPFWRDPTKGVNLRRVFTEPRTLDIVLWVQGTAAAPYLETGSKTSPETWTQLMTVFQGNFFRFFVWVN
jgi:hypothetical protein